MYHHRETHRSILNVSNEDTFPIPLKYIDVMRQTKTNIDSVSQHTRNDQWTEAEDVTLSEDWPGTTRLQILRPRLFEGCKWVSG